MHDINSIIEFYLDSQAWASALADLPADRWLAPMRPGAWSIGECLAHLNAWDRFMVAERLPRIADGATLVAAPDSDAFNADAAAYARSGVTQRALIDEFIATRDALIGWVRRLSTDGVDPTFTIWGEPLTLTKYLHGHIDHDRHHQAEINEAALRSAS